MTTKKHGMTGKRNAAKLNRLDSCYSGRCSREDKALWVKTAQSRGIKLNDLFKIALDAECKKPLDRNGLVSIMGNSNQ